MGPSEIYVFLNVAVIFKMADTTSTERVVLRLKIVGYEVKAPNFAQTTIMTDKLNLAMGDSDFQNG